MARFDTRLVAPTPARLAEGLFEATRRANEGVDLLHLGRDYWEEVIPELLASSEGLRQWSDTQRGDTARVAVAWWRDHVARLHVRILGGNSRDRSYRTLSAARSDPRPPLWHVYPHRLFYRRRDGQGAWLAACACGVCGPPASLGWMGESCGPCHDLRQEGGAAEETALDRVYPHVSSRPRSLVFSPDGGTLATVVADVVDVARVRLHDLETGRWRDLPPTRDTARCLAFSPDGKLLAAEESDSLTVTDLGAGKATLEFVNTLALVDQWEYVQATRLAFAANGRTLALSGRDGVTVWERQGPDADWRLLHAYGHAVTALALSPGGKWLAGGAADGLLLIDLRSAEGRSWTESDVPAHSSVRDLGFTPDGRLAACFSPPDLPPWRLAAPGDPPRTTGELRVYDLYAEGRRLRQAHRLSPVTDAFLAHDAGHVAWLSGANVVTVQEVASGRVLGRLSWDLARRVAGAAFSPDGRTLALLDEEGNAKLVPWRLLLEA
jgi:WD40 repeat protein